MIELIQITNDPAFARRCDELEGMRILVDLERLGKAERQAGRDTFISSHTVADVRVVRQVVRRSTLMVRVNPLHADTHHEVDAVLSQGADALMLPMFRTPEELRAFAGLVAGRVPIVPLLETSDALRSLHEWIDTPGLQEVFVGLNDLHLSLRQRFMFEPLAQGAVEQVCEATQKRGLKFGFGGIARLNEGLLPGRDVLAEHVRLGSSSVILSRTFHREQEGTSFEAEVAALRQAKAELRMRAPSQAKADSQRVREAIAAIAAGQHRCT